MTKKIDDASLYALTQFLDVDINEGEMRLFDQRVGIFPLNSVLEIYSLLGEEFGVEKSRELVYKTGLKFGQKLLDSILQLDKEDFIDFNPLQGHETISKLLSFFGLGRIEYVKYEEENKAVLKYFNSPVKETDNNLFCFFLKGLIVSVMSNMFGTEIEVTETKCTRDNGDYCEFLIYFK